ncbi:MAG: helix-turn-helix domain-containing protein, partial [Oscillospiraceae bacterium]
RGKLENFITVTKKLLEVNEDNFFLRAHDRQLTVIVESNTAQTNTRFFEPVLLKIYDKLTAFFPKNSIYAGVSNICNSLHNLNFTYDEANFALTAGKKLDKDKYLFFYEDYMIFHLLSAVSEHPTINKIYKNTVDRLKKYDGEHEQELLKTLSALVENDFSVAETSKALFIHRNTLYKRIEKINSVLNFNIDQSKNRLLLQLALTLDKML